MLALHQKYTKVQIATVVAVVFHCVGLAGILFFNRNLFVALTPLNLLLSLVLLLYTSQDKNKQFALFVFICFIVGFIVEVVGVNTGYLFGNYSYGTPFGVQLFNVPLLIGVNWITTIFICCTTIQLLLGKLKKNNTVFPKFQIFALIADSATLAVVLDWVMEPVAMKLGFWTWQNDEIPLFNYVCWFWVSFLLSFIFQKCNFNKNNLFAVHLLMIQFMFFLILRISL
jgi:bisanhydrobacterioruberin hydratase